MTNNNQPGGCCKTCAMLRIFRHPYRPETWLCQQFDHYVFRDSGSGCLWYRPLEDMSDRCSNDQST